MAGEQKIDGTGGPWDERLSKNQDGEYFCRVITRGQGCVCAGSEGICQAK